jgi:hypothetical protein
MLPFPTADVTATRLLHALQDTNDPLQIAKLSKQYAELRVPDTHRDASSPSAEDIILSKVKSLAETDPILALTTLEEIADLAAPGDHDNLNQGYRLSVRAVQAWNDLFTSTLEDTKGPASVASLLTAYGAFQSAQAPHMKDVAGQAVVTTAAQLATPFKQAHDLVQKVCDHAAAENNHFLQAESNRVLRQLNHE